jgi:hypothetical protein
MLTRLRGLTMPRPIPVPIRQAMFRLWQQGQATRQIATSLGLPSSTVRRFLQRFRRRGINGIPPDYHHLAASETVPSELMQTAVDASGASHLGGWPDPGAASPGGARTVRPLGANAPALVRASRPVSRSGGTTPKGQLDPGDRSP